MRPGGSAAGLWGRGGRRCARGPVPTARGLEAAHVGELPGCCRDVALLGRALLGGAEASTPCPPRRHRAPPRKRPPGPAAAVPPWRRLQSCAGILGQLSPMLLRRLQKVPASVLPALARAGAELAPTCFAQAQSDRSFLSDVPPRVQGCVQRSDRPDLGLLRVTSALIRSFQTPTPT